MGYGAGDDASLSLRKRLMQYQEELARKIVLKDSFSKLDYVGGVDQAYYGDEVVSVICIHSYPDLEIVEVKHLFDKVKFKYIPGFLSFREGPPIIKVYSKLDVKPDVLLVNGNGIMHFRYIGLASHVGVLLNIPTIGVTQNLLCGKVIHGKVVYKGRHVGYEYQSKKGCKPIYISPGHMISSRSSLNIVKNCITKYKLPLPLHIADRLSKRFIKEYKKTSHP